MPHKRNAMQKKSAKILIAAGGTGGHMFPAQALAEQLQSTQPYLELLFAGAGLSTNRYFHKEKFSHRDISSATPRSLKTLFKAFIALFQGIRQSFKLIKEMRPDLIVGFGSFHAFPVLAAGVLARVPIVLFESNAIPGKVNRIFSRFASFNAVQFGDASNRLKGETIEVSVPIFANLMQREPTREEAHQYYGLDPTLFTILVFGGSQGAYALNQSVCQAAAQLKDAQRQFQIIHFAGAKDNLETIRQSYHNASIHAVVKEFETQMAFAWKAADFVICRAGAATIAEQVHYRVPALFIPFPSAADNHQQKNAEAMEKIGGAKCLVEKELSPDRLFQELQHLFEPGRLEQMRISLSQFQQKQKKSDLANILLHRFLS